MKSLQIMGKKKRALIGTRRKHCVKKPRPVKCRSVKFFIETEPTLMRPTCDFTGSFMDCDCVVHYVDLNTPLIKVHEHEEPIDHYLVIGSSMQKLDSEDDIDYLTYQQLRIDCEKREKLINNTGFEVLKTTSDLTLIQYYEKRFFSIKMVITIDKNFHTTVTVHNKRLPDDHAIFGSIRKVRVFDDLYRFLKSLFDKYTVCIGSPDLVSVLEDHKFVEGDCGARYTETIRTDRCVLLTELTNRCSKCALYRRTLLKSCKRNQSFEVSLSSQRPNSTLSKSDLLIKYAMLKEQCKSVERQNMRLLINQEVMRSSNLNK